MLPPRPLSALCLLLVGLLSWSVAARPLPTVPLAEAARWEGQSVRVEGWASELRDGGLTLSDGGHSLQIRAEGRVGLGDRVEASGRLTRWRGALEMEADGLRVLGGPRPQQASWHDLASWQGTPIRLAGRVEDRRLVGDGASVALGDGPWPAGGAVEATGLLRFDPSCLCHRLDAREVRPWTP